MKRELPSKKEIIKSTLPNIGLILLILFISVVLRADFIVIIALLYGYTIANHIFESVGKEYSSFWDWSWQLIKNLLSLTILIIVYRILSRLLGGHGIWSLILMSLAIGLIILWRKRKIYLMAVRDVERQIFGMTAEERRDKRRKHGRD